MSEMSRLRWQCRRGMKELDVVLGRYLEHHYASATAVQQAQFRKLLQVPDADLYNRLLGRDATTDPECERFLQLIRQTSGLS